MGDENRALTHRLAPADSDAERAARAAGDRLRQSPAPTEPLITHSSDRDAAELSASGRRYFESRVGAGLGAARVHLDAGAADLTRAAHARGVTVGHDIFLAPDHAELDRADSRAVLGHELAHVRRRDPADLIYLDAPYRYPSVEEQKEIEKLLRRRRPPTVPKPPPAAPAPVGPAPGPTPAVPEPVVERGRSLPDAERTALATKLTVDLYKILDQSGPTRLPAPTVANQAEAMTLAEKARKAVFERYGKYLPASANFTLTGTSGPAADRKRDNQVLVAFGAGPRDASSFIYTIIVTGCDPCQAALADLDDASRAAVIDELRNMALRDRPEQIKNIARARVGGSYSSSQRILRISEFSGDPYGTAVHEIIHAVVHPAFWAAFGDERHIIEGFTEYFARQIVSGRGSYESETQAAGKVGTAMKRGSPFLFGGFETNAPEESLRLAYFSGRLDLIGWQPSSKAEADEVTEAGGAAVWNEGTSGKEAAAYQKRALDAQSPHDNLLGVGLLFHKQSDFTFGVRYARVLKRTDALARGQIYTEGQLVGAPISDPKRLGASLGLGIEYQQPWFFSTAGVRLMASGVPGSGEGARFNAAPFVGLGVRAWQRVRVGAEATLLLPLNQGRATLATGATVGVEF